MSIFVDTLLRIPNLPDGKFQLNVPPTMLTRRTTLNELMNSGVTETIKVKITGEIEISQRDFQLLFPEIQKSKNIVTPQFEKLTEISSGGAVPRLAFTMRETAEILGVSYMTVYRLILRGLLKSTSALRTKIISQAEIELFLRETTKADW